MKTTIRFAAILLMMGAPCARGAEYEKDVLPIFEKKCFKCHGDGKAKAGVGLDMDRIGRTIGDVIIRGDLEKSELYQSVITDDRDSLMPPPGKGEKLTQSEIETLRDWIVAGAPLPGDSTSATGGTAGSLFPARAQPVTGEWTNRDGKIITATLLRVDGDKAVLRMAGDKIYRYPIENLSAESQAKVREFEKAEQDS